MKIMEFMGLWNGVERRMEDCCAIEREMTKMTRIWGKGGIDLLCEGKNE